MWKKRFVLQSRQKSCLLPCCLPSQCLFSSPRGFLTSLASYLAVLGSKASDEEHYKGVIMTTGARSVGVCLTVLALLKENGHRGQLSPTLPRPSVGVVG